MKQVNVKKLILPNIPYVFIALLATKVSEAVRLAPGSDASTKLLNIMTGLNTAFHSLVPSFHPIDLCVGVAAAIAIRLAVYIKGKNAKKFRKNLEYGSARWGTAEDIKPYVDPAFENNIILTQTERLTMNSRPKDPKTARNKNVLIVGGSGSGKTRFWLKPNLLQCTSKTYPTSFVVTDPKGDIVVSCGHALQKNGYQIKILNSLNFKKSMHYNPFAYIHSEKDILKLVTTLIANTKGEGKAGDDFWVKAETLLYTALIGYIHYEAPVEEQNFSTLIEFINAMEVREDDEDFKNPVDLMFEELKKRKPDHFAVRQYAKFKLSAGKTAKSILISCGARLAPFDIQELRELTAYDELQLDTLGDRKTALFIIMSDTDDTFNFLISMCYTQLFNLLCEKADDVYGGRLPVHVRCLIDEAANIGQIPRLEKLVATIRSREISCCLVLQAQSQLKALYKDSADTIIGNMDCSIFLGGKEPGTLKELAAALGKVVAGVGPIVVREVVCRALGETPALACDLTKDEQSRLAAALDALKEEHAAGGTPTAVRLPQPDGAPKPVEFSFFVPQQYGAAVLLTQYSSYSEMLEDYYATKDRAERLRQKSRELYKAVHNMHERAVRKQSARREELAQSAKADTLRLYGELLQANLWAIHKGDRQVTVQNYYTGEDVTIRLDPRLGPNDNAQKYFKDYKKKQTAHAMLQKLLVEGEAEIEYLATVLYEVESAPGEAALNEIRAELKSQGYLKYYKQRDRKQKPADFLRYTSSDGFEILVGRNNLQNDKLTLHTARGKDLWFHVQKAPGSHCVVMSRGEDIPDTTKQEAAELAVLHSSQNGGAKVAVDTTEVKNIWKANGAKPGMVLYNVYTTVYVTPRLGLEEQLKKR